MEQTEKTYDYLIVGSGLYGSILAHELNKKGKSVLVLERRPHIAGNIYTSNIEGINVHEYGAHIFHTSNDEVYNYVKQFVEFKDFINQVLANFNGDYYHLPFNMYTFEKIFGVKTPEEAKKVLDEEIKKVYVQEPKNLKEQALNLVGEKVFKILIEGYTEKQWGRKCEDLPPSIIKRLPLRFEYNNNYYNDKYQGIPIGGYTKLIEGLLKGIEVKLNYDYLKHKGEIKANKIIFTGQIDEYYDYCYGALEYRSLRFEKETIDKPDFQNNAVVNYTDAKTPYTRIIEHKYFEGTQSDKTVITKEYPANWQKGDEAYYPINNEKNNELYQKYVELSKKEPNLIFKGRLGLYKYLDMDDVVMLALEDIKNGI